MKTMHHNHFLPAWLVDGFACLFAMLLFRLQGFFDINKIGPVIHFLGEVLGLTILIIRAYITGMEAYNKRKNGGNTGQF
jgi:hypothetical protein